ncbi:hypothetical protein HK405_008137, partial [Cladochytrium tenue]
MPVNPNATASAPAPVPSGVDDDGGSPYGRPFVATYDDDIEERIREEAALTEAT